MKIPPLLHETRVRSVGACQMTTEPGHLLPLVSPPPLPRRDPPALITLNPCMPSSNAYQTLVLLKQDNEAGLLTLDSLLFYIIPGSQPNGHRLSADPPTTLARATQFSSTKSALFG